MRVLDEWRLERLRELRDLRGVEVRGWHGVEMAVLGGEDGEPAVFDGPGIPCLQMHTLIATVADGTGRRFGTYGDPGDCGLLVTAVAPSVVDPRDGFFRERALPQLPVGRIGAATIWLSDGEIAEVELEIDGAPLLLMAGESYKDHLGNLKWVRGDECVLTFTQPDLANIVNWVPPRAGLTLAD